MNEIPSSTTKVFDYVLAFLDSIENTTSSSVVSDDVAQQWKDTSVILEWRSALLNEIDLRLSTIDDQLAITEQGSISTLPPAPTTHVSMGPCNSEKGIYMWDINFGYLKDSSPSDSDEEYQLNRRALLHSGHLPLYLGWKKSPQYLSLKKLRHTNPIYIHALSYCIDQLKDVS